LRNPAYRRNHHVLGQPVADKTYNLGEFDDVVVVVNLVEPNEFGVLVVHDLVGVPEQA
jgi:hypothetical protein